MTIHYHYTNLSALLNIFQLENVWFSGLSYMNDQMEGLELHRVLTEISQEANNSKEYKQLLLNVEGMSKVFLSNKYLFSSTELRDDISQWRAYTSLGHGVCLGFEDTFISDETIIKKQCIYDLIEKKDFLIKNTQLLQYIDNKLKNEKNNKPTAVVGLVNSVLDVMEHFKHESFSPEKEVRWIDDLNSTKCNNTIKYRTHRLGILPYREIRIDLRKISEIILGPLVPDQNIYTIQKLFIEKNLNPEIIKSHTTLR